MNESAPITTSTRAQQAIGALYLGICRRADFPVSVGKMLTGRRLGDKVCL